MIDIDNFEINNTLWVILKPRSNIDEIIGILDNLDKSEIPNDLYLEKVFSREPEIPEILNYIQLDIKKNQKFVQIKSTDQKAIETIGGNYFYKFYKQINLILTERLWLIDKELYDIIRKIRSDYHFEIIENNWSKLSGLISKCKRVEIRDYSYIQKNSTDYGRIYSVYWGSSRSEVYGRRLSFSEDIEKSTLKSSSSLENIERLSLHTYLPDKNKLRWTIYRNGTIRTNKTNIKGLEKFIEFILDFEMNKVFFIQTDILDFF